MDNIPIAFIDKEETNSLSNLRAAWSFGTPGRLEFGTTIPTLTAGRRGVTTPAKHSSITSPVSTVLRPPVALLETVGYSRRPSLTSWKVIARLLGNEPMSCSGAGVDGRLFIGLLQARDFVDKISSQLPETPRLGSKKNDPKETIKQLQDHLEDLRKENARVTASAVRMRQTWVTLSRLIRDTLTVLQDPALSPSVARTRALAALIRSHTHDVLFRADQLPPVPLLGIDDQ
ncbi:hypothetical protein CC1G_07040 [Coprinopsis cinerea okayama7|uniref:Uncharacterized protein n=1 Tax=Coprinopsis cinerea (strain Okayama-7 / 130 / ATCC MYA-4618 / FGSC 9003) TaxID=240176 RepID=A8NAY7_COPC7|nr:hypothetical protein CC1G_07040 [Coprinopsis cinerea okayama7\|eukprot:XP_001831989.2 hypothetical protein CC1G_07040 [Coprinopsis cinerea okayama7\